MREAMTEAKCLSKGRYLSEIQDDRLFTSRMRRYQLLTLDISVDDWSESLLAALR